MILVVAGQRLKVPFIMLLLIGGVVLGPEVLGWIDPASLGNDLEKIMALAVAVILFEGGLSLDLEGYNRASVVIKRMITLGALVTWLGASVAINWLFELEVGMALMAGSLLIVTGPSVVSPLLKRLRVIERLHHALYWEGVLINAVGVSVAVLCYEWLTPDAAHPLMQPLSLFGLRLVVGLGLGLGAGLVVANVLNRSWIAEEQVRGFVLVCALLTFGTAHILLAESGIVATAVAGVVVGLRGPQLSVQGKRLRLPLTDLGVGILFILLASRLEVARFADVRLLALVAIVMFLLRPAATWLATFGRRYTVREKILIAWIAPRGIVAAALASLFSIRLQELGRPEAVYLETFTYAVIAATVTFQGLSAASIVRLLGLKRPQNRAWVLWGNTTLVGALGRGLKRAGVPVVELTGLDATSDAPDQDDPRLADAAAVLCAETTMLQNIWATSRWSFGMPQGRCFRWATFEPPESAGAPPPASAGQAVWSNTVSAAAAAEGLASGSYAIDVVEVGDRDELGRFGKSLQPLFWVDDARAHIIVDPHLPGAPRGDLAVVLRRRVFGLDDLIAHVEIVNEAAPCFEDVLRELARAANQIDPELPLQAAIDGILDRRQTMPAAVGAGIAIPHAYCDELERRRCYLAVVPAGVQDMITPDEQPVRLVFLLVSPTIKPTEHLESLAALASLAQEPELIDLLCRQRVPERVTRLIDERV